MTATIQFTTASHLHFVTGKLAEQAVRDAVVPLASRYGFEYSIEVLPITVAALMTPGWLARKWNPPDCATHVILPGYFDTELAPLTERTRAQIVIGPKDCRRMGELFGEKVGKVALDRRNIEIIAEINHAPRLSEQAFVALAEALIADGADRIDIGCDPANRCREIDRYVGHLKERGIPCSIDTFDPVEAKAASEAGASLVLSVNASNREQAVDWGCEVVVVPDQTDDLRSFHQTVEFLADHKVPMRLDPILEPIGAGLAASLVRYSQVRERYPDLPMMMGIGNLTELTDVDSAGINVVLLGICQELKIQSVLTTQVINWARSSVRECDHAGRLVYAAVTRGRPPKNLSDDLVMLRDRKLVPHSEAMLAGLAEAIKDNNYRLFAQNGEIHLLSRRLHLRDADPFQLFDRLLEQEISDNVDRGHAFYLGYEMAKASIALVLGKQYDQDRALQWGMLTREEDLHRLERSSRHRKKTSS